MVGTSGRGWVQFRHLIYLRPSFNAGCLMQLGQSLSMRPEMRQLLTPRMIQSMEILQMPLAQLEERLAQELQSNPVLELAEGETEPVAIPEGVEERQERAEGEQVLRVDDNGQAADFDRLERISEYLENEEYSGPSSNLFRQASSFDGERDKKMDAMANHAARSVTLQEHLMGQWAFAECPLEVRKAGEAIINYIDAEG